MSTEIINTHNRIKQFIHRTPILKSQQINNLMGCNISFKCENFQKAGAFKSRGAVNAVLQLSDEQKEKGVCTHSSGNFAQALARAANIVNVKSYIVMPSNAPQVKVDATRGYGGDISLCEPNLQARESTANAIITKYGATLLHPYNNWDVIYGQATAAKEFIEDSETEMDYLIAPLGGGGLLSGTALSAKAFSPNTKVIGAEPINANDAYKSFKTGVFVPSNNPDTIADGLLTSLGDITFTIIKENVEDIMLCSEDSIRKAMQIIYSRMKIVVEPSSAVALAIILENKKFFANKNIGIIISGGNIDLDDFLLNLK